MKKIRNFNNRVFRFIEELIFDHHWDDIGMMRRGDIRTEALWFLLILLAIIVFAI